MSAFKSNHGFCPTGFQTVRVGMVEVHMGRDPSDPGKTHYPHYNSVAVLEVFGLDPHKTWRSLEVFERELRKGVRRELIRQLDALDDEEHDSACPTCGADGGTTCGAVNCGY